MRNRCSRRYIEAPMMLRPLLATHQRRVRGILAIRPCACSRLKQRLTLALALFGSPAHERNLKDAYERPGLRRETALLPFVSDS